MNAARLPNGKRFRNVVIAESLVVSLITLTLVSCYLAALLRLSPEQWRAFLCSIATLFVVLFVVSTALNQRIYGPIIRHLDERAAGTADSRSLREAFVHLSDLPRISFAIGGAWWLVGGVLVGSYMGIRFDGISALTVAIMILSASSVGVVSMIFHYFLIKRIFGALLTSFAAEIGDPEVRQSLVWRVPLARKLRVSITSVTMVATGFAILLSSVQANRSIEAFTTDLQQQLIDRAIEANPSMRELPSFDPAQFLPRQFEGSEFVLLDSDVQSIVAGPVDMLLSEEIRAIAELGAERGDSSPFDSLHNFSWRRLESDGRVLVLVMPAQASSTRQTYLWTILGVFSALALLISWGVARLVGDDVSKVSRSMRDEVDRLAAGDLTPGRILESEDEFGDLSRSFERMAATLRATVERFAGAAQDVDSTATRISGVIENLAEATGDEAHRIRQVSSTMDHIQGQVGGIAGSASALSQSIEESAAAVMQFGVTGEELSRNATDLSSKAQGVGSSIEQMITSSAKVTENIEELAAAAGETSTSMDQMATSLREVDGNAEETGRLSQRMVELAESGREKVAETIRGMEAIARATDTAEQVIHNLGHRASEIGSIVRVINDVADETNLLALNAAIIAAQAGEHGRAFSVVADEIKDLADRVISSTQEIGGLIRGVQEESENAIGAIEGGAASVRGGVDLSAQAGVALEEITAAARESGTRISEIASAVQEQSRAATHVVQLMERVRYGAEQIHDATAEQARGNEAVLLNSASMRDVARLVRGSTEEQATGAHRMRDNVESVRTAVSEINSSLQEQTAACQKVAEFLERMNARVGSNEESAAQMREAMRGLVQQAEALHEDVGHFRIRLEESE